MLPELTKGQRDDLERLIDRHGLGNLLKGIAHICADKSEHVLTAWQDRQTSRAWDKAEIKIYNLSESLSDLVK